MGRGPNILWTSFVYGPATGLGWHLYWSPWFRGAKWNWTLHGHREKTSKALRDPSYYGTNHSWAKFWHWRHAETSSGYEWAIQSKEVCILINHDLILINFEQLTSSESVSYAGKWDRRVLDCSQPVGFVTSPQLYWKLSKTALRYSLAS